MVHFGYLKCLLSKPIMLCMLHCHGTYCSLQGIPLYASELLKLHFIILKLANVGKNVGWTCPETCETGCEGSMARCQDHVGSFNPHPWWQLLGTDGMLHYQALFLSHFHCMILALLNQRLQNHFGRFPPDLTLLFTLWVRQNSSLSPVPIICK